MAECCSELLIHNLRVSERVCVCERENKRKRVRERERERERESSQNSTRRKWERLEMGRRKRNLGKCLQVRKTGRWRLREAEIIKTGKSNGERDTDGYCKEGPKGRAHNDSCHLQRIRWIARERERWPMKSNLCHSKRKSNRFHFLSQPRQKKF